MSSKIKALLVIIIIIITIIIIEGFPSSWKLGRAPCAMRNNSGAILFT